MNQRDFKKVGGGQATKNTENNKSQIGRHLSMIGYKFSG